MLMRMIAVAVVFLLSTLWHPNVCFAQAQPGSEERLIDHGVPAAVSESRGAIATVDGEGRPIILATALDIHNGASRTSLLVIDAQTGETQQYWYPDENAPAPANFCLMVSSKNMFYMMLGDVFLEFDIAQRAWTFAKNMGLGMAMALAEGPDGTIYAGTYPHLQLLAFDPKTREITHLGQLDPVQKYAFSLVTDPAGWIYAGVGTASANIVAFNVQTKECRQLVEESDRSTGTGQIHRGKDGLIYGRLPNRPWLRLHDGQAEPVDEASPKASIMNIRWGATFKNFPDGGALTAFDLTGKSFSIVDAQGNKSTVTFDYVSAGAGITSMIAGPGKKVYGSTCHPFRFFACDAQTGALETFGGLRRVGGGNFCGLAVLDDTVYGAAYCGGWLYAYDTTKAWRDSQDESANPRIVAKYAEITRPRAALALPDKKHVIYVGYPGYGHVGGSIGFYDVAADEATLLDNEAILPGQSTVTIKALPDGNLVGGTSIAAPGGAEPVAKAGHLYMMDWQTRKVVFDVQPVPGASEVNCIEVAPNGNVYGITNTAQLFVFDPATKEIVCRHDLAGHGGPLRPDQSLLLGPAGRLYALLSRALIEISTEDHSPRKVAELPAGATAGGAICNGRLYYAVGSHVWSCRLETP